MKQSHSIKNSYKSFPILGYWRIFPPPDIQQSSDQKHILNCLILFVESMSKFYKEFSLGPSEKRECSV